MVCKIKTRFSLMSVIIIKKIDLSLHTYYCDASDFFVVVSLALCEITLFMFVLVDILIDYGLTK